MNNSQPAHNNDDDEHLENQQSSRISKANRKRKQKVAFAVAFGGVIICISLALIPLAHFLGGHAWDSPHMIATYAISGALVTLILSIGILFKTVRTRYSIEREILEHRDVNEYTILWDRPRWTLYFPTMALSIVFGILRFMMPGVINPEILGGIWVVAAIVNIFIEQLHMSIKTVLILIPSAAVILLLLHMMGIGKAAFQLSALLLVDIHPKLYFIVALVIETILLIGWLHGLFNYMAITPNVADMQRGLTETGRQIKNSDYDISFDATDVVERWIFGFGRIIISFPRSNQPPIVFFVPHAAKIAETIRRVRSVTAIDGPENQG